MEQLERRYVTIYYYADGQTREEAVLSYEGLDMAIRSFSLREGI